MSKKRFGTTTPFILVLLDYSVDKDDGSSNALHRVVTSRVGWLLGAFL